jgi:hypothetical protein
MLVNAYELLGMWDMERFEENCIDDGKDRGVGTDTEGERDHRHDGEAGILKQLAEGEF